MIPRGEYRQCRLDERSFAPEFLSSHIFSCPSLYSIREAIAQEDGEKALAGFGLMDTFDGVDEKLLTLTATVYVEVSVSGGIFQVRGVKLSYLLQ